MFTTLIINVIITIMLISFVAWLESVGSRVVYELDYRSPVLYVIQSILENQVAQRAPGRRPMSQ